MKLPEEVKLLINEGIYSLYPIVDDTKAETFVLALGAKKTFLLDSEGNVLKEDCGDLKSFSVKLPITFPEVASGNTLLVNGL